VDDECDVVRTSGSGQRGEPSGTREEPSLVALGVDEVIRAEFAPHAAAGLTLGRVVRADRGFVVVSTGLGHVMAENAMALVKTVGHDPEPLPAAGDWVALRDDPVLDVPLVEAVLPRKSAIVRRDPGKAAVGQVLGANIDTVFIVQSIEDEPNVRRLERELALAWESGATPVVVLNKADMSADAAAAITAVEAVAIGVDILLTSAETGEGVERLRDYTRPHRTVVLIGPSGAGKSTIVNLLAGGDVQTTAEVRDFDGKGRHTTVARELIPLADGGVLIDTPGIRAVAMWDAAEGLSATFPEIEELARACRFADCAHDGEPGCAVAAAVEDGRLPAERLDSYRKLGAEMQRSAGERDLRIRAEQKGKGKALAKEIKRFHRERGR
jgi:ribosome small subunit-dependent GTPase A